MTNCHIIRKIHLIVVCIMLVCTSACVNKNINQNQMPEKTIEQVLKENTASLMALPGVVGTAQALCNGTPCIKVYNPATKHRTLRTSIRSSILRIQRCPESLDRVLLQDALILAPPESDTLVYIHSGFYRYFNTFLYIFCIHLLMCFTTSSLNL